MPLGKPEPMKIAAVLLLPRGEGWGEGIMFGIMRNQRGE